MEQSLTQRQQEWANRVGRWRESKLGREEFAAQEGVSGKRLAWWDWKLRKLGVVPPEEPRPEASAPSFVRLEVAGPFPSVEQAEPLELVLSGGQRVRIPVGFDAGTLSRVVSVLAGGAA